MKKLLILIAIGSAASLCAQGQNHEWQVRVHTSNALFVGSGVRTPAQLMYGSGNRGSVDRFYGKYLGAGYGFGLRYDKVFKNNFLLGGQAGYESAQSRNEISSVNSFLSSSSIGFPAEGTVKLNMRQITLSPLAGYQFLTKKVRIRLHAQPELSRLLYVRESGFARTENPSANYESSLNRQTISWDYRLGFSAAVHKNAYGLFVGYSFGFANYESATAGGAGGDSRSRILRAGVSHQLNR